MNREGTMYLGTTILLYCISSKCDSVATARARQQARDQARNETQRKIESWCEMSVGESESEEYRCESESERRGCPRPSATLSPRNVW